MNEATPYTGPPPPVPRQRRRGGVVWPLILIFLGGVFLLENMGYLPPNFWMGLWRMWPLVLVLVGIELLFAHRIPWIALAGLAAVVLLVGAVATRSSLPAAEPRSSTTASVQTDLLGASQAAVTLRFGAGQLNVGPIEQPNPDELASMTYAGPPEFAPVPRYTPVGGGVGQLEYQSGGRGGPGFFPWANPGGSQGSPHLDLNLSPDVPITSFTVQTGGTDARLDLSTLRVSAIDMSIGAATTWVRFPQAGTTTAHVSGGASTITLEIPQGVAAQIRHRGGLSTINVDQSRFPQVSEGLFRSPDYDAAQNRVDIILETGVTTIQVN